MSDFVFKKYGYWEWVVVFVIFGWLCSVCIYCFSIKVGVMGVGVLSVWFDYFDLF